VSSSIVQSIPGAHWQKTFFINYIIRSNKDYFNYTSHLVFSYKEHVQALVTFNPPKLSHWWQRWDSE